MDVLPEEQTKPLSRLSAYSYIPPRRNEPKEMSYFNTDSKVSGVSTYDQVFHQIEGFDMRLPRDDRKHWHGRGLDINKEERSRVVPVLSSSEYGRRSSAALFQTHQRHGRVACVQSDFYMKNGILWNLEEGFGSVVPI